MAKAGIHSMAGMAALSFSLVLSLIGCGSADKPGSSSKKSEGSGSAPEKTMPKSETKTESKHEGS